MSGAVIRSAVPGEEAALRALWKEVFHDEDAAVDAFFECLYAPENTLVAVCGGELVSAAYLLRGIELRAGGQRRPAAYFYALATKPEARGRGLGRAITREALRLSAGRGETLCLMPGDDGLRRWYEEIAGMRSFGTWREFSCAASAAQGIELTEIGAGEYAARREALLAGIPHAALPEAIFRWKQALCRMSGGALLALRGPEGEPGLACAERWTKEDAGGELLYAGRTEDAAAAIAARFGARRYAARTPGEGVLSVMAAPPTPGSPFWWGPVFD